MITVTIPKEFQDEKYLVALPPSFYEEFLEVQKKVKNARTFKPTSRDLLAIARGRANFRKRNFTYLKDL